MSKDKPLRIDKIKGDDTDLDAASAGKYKGKDPTLKEISDIVKEVKERPHPEIESRSFPRQRARHGEREPAVNRSAERSSRFDSCRWHAKY